jgi:hypothetical protein
MRAVLLTWAWTTRISPREALDDFFRRRGEAGKFYCAACLAPRLTRGVGAFLPAAVKAAWKTPASAPACCGSSPAATVGPARKLGRVSASVEQGLAHPHDAPSEIISWRHCNLSAPTRTCRKPCGCSRTA